ncbi:ribonucleoside triphosphate reductase [Patescibacteria group bacterium]
MTKTKDVPFEKVRKRDGRIVDFDIDRIATSIFKAAQSVGGKDRETASNMAWKVADSLEKEYKKKGKGYIPAVEQIQDMVERTLIYNSYADTAKSFILYRDQQRKIRDTKSILVDATKTMDEYLKREDWRVNENSNVNYSFSGLSLHLSGAIIANYTLENIYPQEIADAHKSGSLHIHDLSFGINGYCAGWSIKDLLLEGFNGVDSKVESAPAKHLPTVVGQLINFLGTLQNEWAGAQAFSSFDTYLAPFVREDNLNYKAVKQSIQQFVFSMNTPSRWGCQTPFTNLTFDWTVPADMKDQNVIVGGKILDDKYADYQKEMDMINKAFMEVMLEGDMKGRIFTFPIPTYNITKDFEWDSDNAKLLFEMTAKYGMPYFQNFINSDLKPSDVRSMCCRLQMDLRQLSSKTGGLFGSGEKTGSLGVVTINLPRLAYESKNETEFFTKLESLMDLGQQSLEIKRELVERNMNNGLLPYTKRYLGDLSHHFATIGLVGMNEALMNFFDEDTHIATEKGSEFALKVLDFMREKLAGFQKATGNIYNLEATPAEGTSYRLARMDKDQYPDIIAQGKEEPFYTNSSHLPVDYTEDIFEALEHQDDLQTKYTGGTVFHGFLGERIKDTESCKKLVKTIAHNFHLPYFTITPTFSICPEHGYLAGEKHKCSCEK